MAKTVLITGSSSGFGRLTAKLFQRKGWNVVATMRRPEEETELLALENTVVQRLDVTNKGSIEAAVAAADKRFGGVDVLVNNAGYGALGPMEAGSDESIRRQMDVNYFGLIDVTKAVLPQMRDRGDGTIINISSMGGRVTFPFTALYHASKFAVEGLTEALQYELNPMGIRLKLVEPGAFQTDFTKSMTVTDVQQIPAYEGPWQDFVSAMQSMMGAGQDPQEVADTVFAAATDESEQLRYPVGEDATQVLGARATMDDVAFKRMIAERMGVKL